MAVRSTKCQNRAVRKGGGGVTLMTSIHLINCSFEAPYVIICINLM